MSECIYLHSYQIPSTNENLWRVLKQSKLQMRRLCCKSVDSDGCCLILQEKKVFWQKLHRSSSSLLFPHSVLPDSQTSLCTLCWAQICTIPQTCLMGFFPLIFLVCLFSFVLTDPFEHFQVQPWPSETRWWGSGACCLATGSKLACVAVVALCNSGFDGWM